MKHYNSMKYGKTKFKINPLHRWISSLLLLLGLFFFPPQLFAQTIEYQLIDQLYSAEVDASGQTVFYNEYRYDAVYLPRLSYQVPTMGHELSRYRVGVREENASQITYLTETASGVAGSFQMLEQNGMAEFTITYPLANEETSIIIEYILDGLVTNYTDTAYWVNQLVLHPDLQGRDIQLELVLPGPLAGEEDFRLWVHGYPISQQQKQTDAGQTRMHLSFPYETVAEEPIQVNAIFPTSLTPNNDNIVEVMRKEAIITHEEALHQAAEQASNQSQRQIRWIFILFVILPLLGSGILLAIFLGKRNSQTSVTLKESIISSSPPETLAAPLVKQVIYNRGPDANDLAATLLEIARKGYLQLTVVQVAKRSQTQTRSGYTIKINRLESIPNLHLLTTYERQVYQLFAPPTEIGHHTLEEMVSKATNNKSYRREKEVCWQKFCDAIILKALASKSQGRNYKRPLIFAAIFWMMISSLTFVWMIYYALNQGIASWLGIGLPLSILNIILLVALIVLIARHQFLDQDQLEKRLAWEAFGFSLRHSYDYDLPSQADIVQWEKNLIYAVALDTTGSIQQTFTHQFDMTELENKSPSTNQDLYRFHGSIANVLQPSIREFLGVINPQSKLKHMVKHSQ